MFARIRDRVLIETNSLVLVCMPDTLGVEWFKQFRENLRFLNHKHYKVGSWQ